jgi:O-antigen ligase
MLALHASLVRFGPRRLAPVVALTSTVVVAVTVVVAGPTLCVLVVVGAGAAIATATLPGVVLAAYLLSGTYKAVLQPFSPVDITVLLAGLNAAQIVPLTLRGRPRNVSSTGVLAMVSVGFLYLAGVLYAPDQDRAVYDVTYYWALTLVPILPAAARVGGELRYVRQLLWALFALGLPMLAAGIAQLTSSSRLVAFGASTIEVGRAVLLVPLVGMTFVVHQQWRVLRALTIIVIPAALMVAVATGSRGPLFAFLILVAIGAIRYVSRPGAINWRVGGAIAALAVVSMIVMSTFASELPGMSLSRIGVFEDFVGRVVLGNGDPAVLDPSAGRRLTLYSLAASMFAERPLLGFGTGGFAATFPRYFPPPYYEWPHNAILQFAGEFGIVGLAAFAVLVSLALMRRFPRGHPGTALLAALAFWILNSMVSDDIYGCRTTWGLMLLVFLIEVPPALQVTGVSARGARDVPEVDRPSPSELAVAPASEAHPRKRVPFGPHVARSHRAQACAVARLTPEPGLAIGPPNARTPEVRARYSS